ncbi:MAG: ATP-dependent RecD-like DNA helicase [Gammaproteobacteria bacterium]|nr:ATP-dependent RecD-like DNA helicase [Gammaproteobacteria bacterium]
MKFSFQELKEWASKLDPKEIGSFTQNKIISGRDRKFVYDIVKKSRKLSDLSERQLQWLHKIYIQIKEPNSGSAYGSSKTLSKAATEAILDCDVKHLVLRLAWHDNRWNGRICKKPQDNVYCVGEHSLLSDRIRKRRNLEKECHCNCAGFPPDKQELGGYQPPCFWSINAFGQETLEFDHDNPVASDFPHIPQPITPYSVISWPFKLAFVKNKAERTQYGNYYPKEIFENRIKIFQKHAEPYKSLVFLYCKYSNPVSGENMEYLVAGCALLKEKGNMEWFNINKEQLAKTAGKLNQPNFPDLNWALRYTMDFEDTGVRIPYHEYLELMDQPGGVGEEYLQEIAVTIQEPELRDGFTYVARQVDDDQAIYLLMKLRRSLFKVREHAFLSDYDSEEALEKVDLLLEHAWNKRGYFPGLKNLLFAIPEIKHNYFDQVSRLIDNIDLSDKASYTLLLTFIENQESDSDDINELLEEVSEYLDTSSINAFCLLQLASLNLTENQFSTILNSKNLFDICQNPYLLFEDYEPDELLEDNLSGEKIDGSIDLFKIDIALFPHIKYIKKIKELHTWKTYDKRRLRSVVLDILQQRENKGDCFLETETIDKQIESYPLFYKIKSEYKISESLASPSEETEQHFKDKIVIKKNAESTIYYLKELYDAELFVEETIKHLLKKHPYELSSDSLTKDIHESVKKLSVQIGESFDPDLFIQERTDLYNKIVNQPITILTGSPGSGKSRELLKSISYFNRRSEVSLILTLTGKAALRLINNDEDFKGINAQTIDKFLTEIRIEAEKGTTRVVHNLIIDEASMTDLPKLAEILHAANTSSNHFKRLILVGDENQLPPIGFGKPFSDIVSYVKSEKSISDKCFIYLESNCRAELPNSFIDFTRVFSDENKLPEEPLSATDREGEICDGGISIRHWSNKVDLYNKIDSELEHLLVNDEGNAITLPEFLGIRDKSKTPPIGLEKFQILSPKKSGFSGVSGLNLHFQEDLRKEIEYLPSGGDVAFKPLDKVMHTVNEYRDNELFVSNGSLGGIVANNKVFFLEKDKAIGFRELRNKDALELAYAITVHKSQGSGFNHVFCVLPEKSKFIGKELLYTALTRTKNKVTIFIHKPNHEYSIQSYLSSIRKNSAILTRRTSLLKTESDEYAYTPAEGVNVKSRVEFIIYQELNTAQQTYGNFGFNYEEVYELEHYDFNIHPDFVLHFDDGRTVYWEHLGRVTSKSYMRGWDQRRKLYEGQGEFSKVITTDELSGISGNKIKLIIESLVRNEMQSEDSSNRYSKMHFSLR